MLDSWAKTALMFFEGDESAESELSDKNLEMNLFLYETISTVSTLQDIYYNLIMTNA